MIIIEGPNNTGKSFFARELCADLSNSTDRYWRVHKYKGAPSTPEQADKRILESEMLIKLPNVIQDRSSIISEYIYSTAMDKEPRIGLMDSISKLHSSKPILIFLLDMKSNSTRNPLHDRKLSHIHLMKIKELYDNYIYKFIAANLNLDDLFIYRDNMTSKQLLNGIIRAIMKRKQVYR